MASVTITGTTDGETINLAAGQTEVVFNSAGGADTVVFTADSTAFRA